MERGEERPSPASEDAIRIALDAIHHLKATGIDPVLARKLDEAARALAGTKTGATGDKSRPFGAFAGRFAIGPEFFEPMTEADLRSWVSD